MLSVLTDPILPIFMVMVAGFVLRKTGSFDVTAATAINRYVFFLGSPALVFYVIVTAPLDQFVLSAMLNYLAMEIILYGSVFFITHRLLNVEIGEAILLGFAACFVNHIFFVRPIAELVYGEAAVFPIAGIVVIDSILFCTSVFLVDLTVAKKGNTGAALKSLSRNPLILATIAAFLVWWVKDWAPSGLFTFAEFVGRAAAPASLFALGIVLANTPLTRFGPALFVVIAAKLIMLPVLVYAGIQALSIEADWANLTLLLAAGPTGAMPFLIATQYGVKTDTIAKAILLTSLLSVVSLAILI